MSKQYLGRTAILGTTLRTEEVEIEEWGGTVLIREPSAADARFLANLPEDRQRNAYWVARCVVDKSGERVFQDADVPALAKKSNTVINYLVNRIIDGFGLLEKKARLEMGNAPPSD